MWIANKIFFYLCQAPLLSPLSCTRSSSYIGWRCTRMSSARNRVCRIYSPQHFKMTMQSFSNQRCQKGQMKGPKFMAGLNTRVEAWRFMENFNFQRWANRIQFSEPFAFLHAVLKLKACKIKSWQPFSEDVIRKGFLLKWEYTYRSKTTR